MAVDSILQFGDIADLRYNPFTGTYDPIGIGYDGNSAEVRTVPNTAPHQIKLFEIPQETAPSTFSVTPSAGGDALREVGFNQAPASGEYRVSYSGVLGAGIVEFNAAQKGVQMDIKYYGLGTIEQKIALLLNTGYTFIIASSDSYYERADVVIDTGEDAAATINSYITTINAAGGGRIVLLDGTYNVEQTITMKSNIILEGNGHSTVIKKSAANANNAVINMTSANNSSVKNLKIDGSADTYSELSYGIRDDNNYTNNYSGIFITEFYGNTSRCFYFCNNVVNCYAASTDGSIGFSACYNISNCYASSCSAGFSGCDQISSCYSLNSPSVGFDGCEQISSCQNYNSTLVGFNNCKKMSSCYSYSAGSYGFDGCLDLSSCESESDTTRGFSGCERITGCYAKDVATGFYLCFQVSSCRAYQNTTAGFDDCEEVSACRARNNVGTGAAAAGFSGCVRISACYSRHFQDGFNSCNNVTSSTSENNYRYGFRSCNSILGNKATGNTTANYSLSYADSGAAQAAADTANGGYNS